MAESRRDQVGYCYFVLNTGRLVNTLSITITKSHHEVFCALGNGHSTWLKGAIPVVV